MPKKPPTLPELIRQLITDSGLSHYELQKRSGVSQSVLSRFMSEDAEVRRDITLETAGRILLALEVTLVPRA